MRRHVTSCLDPSRPPSRRGYLAAEGSFDQQFAAMKSRSSNIFRYNNFLRQSAENLVPPARSGCSWKRIWSWWRWCCPCRAHHAFLLRKPLKIAGCSCWKRNGNEIRSANLPQSSWGWMKPVPFSRHRKRSWQVAPGSLQSSGSESLKAERQGERGWTQVWKEAWPSGLRLTGRSIRSLDYPQFLPYAFSLLLNDMSLTLRAEFGIWGRTR